MQEYRLTHLIKRYLNDAVLGLFALISLFLLLTPYVFQVSTFAQSAISVVGYAIVMMFAIEYFAGLAAAKNKSQFVLDGWRIIDALIIASAIVAATPVVPDVLRHSPVFRLIRVGRLTLLGARSTLALKPEATEHDTAYRSSETALKVLSLGTSGTRFEANSWDEGLARIRSAESDWLFFSGVNEARLAPIADAMSVPVKAVQRLFKSASPGFDSLERFSTFFVRYPLRTKPSDCSRSALRRSSL